MGANLKARVQQTAAAQTGQPDAVEAPESIETAALRLFPHLAAVSPSHDAAAAEQLVADTITALRSTPGLAECEPGSILGGVTTCAQLGLRLGVLGHAWLLPITEPGKGRREQQRAQLVIGYRGLVELAHRSGQIASLVARTVYANDHFDVDYGVADQLVHKPTLTAEAGAPVAYYALVKYRGGGHAFWVMSQADAEAHRNQYAMARDDRGEVVGPWATHFEDMARKTVVRQLAKWMPQSTDLALALEADGSVRTDVRPDAALEHPDGDVEDPRVQGDHTVGEES